MILSFKFKLLPNNNYIGFSLTHANEKRIKHWPINKFIDLANKMLGYKYYITGEVIKGDGIGKKIKYPTANILPVKNSKLIPGNGVYVCQVNFDNKNLRGMLNIGNRPTVDGKERRIELHIFDFNTNIYGKNVKISLITKIRDEIKFNNLDELKDQLQKDEIKSINILNNEKI